MKDYFYEFLTVLLMAGSLFFFYESIDHLAHRDYVAASILTLTGLAILTVGREMARLALAQKDSQ